MDLHTYDSKCDYEIIDDYNNSDIDVALDGNVDIYLMTIVMLMIDNISISACVDNDNIADFRNHNKKNVSCAFLYIYIYIFIYRYIYICMYMYIYIIYNVYIYNSYYKGYLYKEEFLSF